MPENIALEIYHPSGGRQYKYLLRDIGVRPYISCKYCEMASFYFADKLRADIKCLAAFTNDSMLRLMKRLCAARHVARDSIIWRKET